MNQTFNKRTYNPVSFDLFLNSKKDSRQKKSNGNYNTKNAYKEIISGSNYTKQHTTIFNNYNHFSSLTKCNSMAKLTKTQSNSYISSKSFMTSHQERQSSPFQSPSINNVGKNRNEKSTSTMQSTDERKELSRIKEEIKEKNNKIKSLNKTIDGHVQDKNAMTKEMMDMKMKLAEIKLENSKIKQENKILHLAYQKIRDENNKLLAKESKLAEIMTILSKDERTIYRSEEDIVSKGEEDSLSGICFTDKIQMQNKMESIDTNLPALDLNGINEEGEGFNNDRINYNVNNITIHPNKNKNCVGNSYNVKAKILFGKTFHI